jgi:drug/metabolite transporter (DMT)-like permease
VRTFGIIAGLAAASIWGGMYVVSKVVLDVIPPFALISLRLILGAGCLAIILAGRGGFKAKRRQFGEIVLVGVVGYGISLGLQFVGTKLSTAANGALVTSASPAFIFIFGAWLLSEQVTWKRLAALILATLGVIAVIDPRKVAMGDQVFWGNVALLGAALTWGLYSVLVKKASLKLGTLEVSLIAFLGGMPISLPLSALEIATLGVGRITLPVIFGVLYLGLVSTALAMYLWNKSLAILDAGLVSLLFFAQPVVGVGLGAWLLKERLSMGFWVGAILISLGLILSAGTDSSKRAVVEQ